jgi:hypothetical protein
MSQAFLGIAVYPPDKLWKNIKLLVRSIMKNSPDLKIFLITAVLGEKDKSYIKKYNIHAIEIIDLISYNRIDNQYTEEYVTWLTSIWIKRHTYYLQVLKEINVTYILLADTRDVIITADLKSLYNITSLLLSQEDSNYSISTEPHNHKWISEGYGLQILDNIGNKPILCAGCIYGSKTQVVNYINSMMKEFDMLGNTKAEQIGDQAIHNYLAYNNLLPEYEISTAENGYLKSIGIMKTDVLNTKLFNHSNRLELNNTLVLHQYDRHLKSKKVCRLVKKICGIHWWERI